MESGGGIPFDTLGFEHFDLHFLLVVAGRLFIAAALGALISYRFWRRLMPWPFEPTESGAQTLIAVAGSLMTAVIGSAGELAPALAFALVGLGGFIRFRSGIKDPREAGVMFFMIGIGMAVGIGMMPVALIATVAGIGLLVLLDLAESKRRRLARRRLRFSEIKEPRELEPRIRAVIEKAVHVRGSKVSLRREEVIVDIYGDEICTAGDAMQILEKAGIPISGDVACEEL
jgi:uncharacterized membrane protein YhiD involved in acid resistance